jgi:hypothetical protein
LRMMAHLLLQISAARIGRSDSYAAFHRYMMPLLLLRTRVPRSQTSVWSAPHRPKIAARAVCGATSSG